MWPCHKSKVFQEHNAFQQTVRYLHFSSVWRLDALVTLQELSLLAHSKVVKTESFAQRRYVIALLAQLPQLHHCHWLLLVISEGHAGLLFKLILLTLYIYNVQIIRFLAFAGGPALASVSILFYSRPRRNTRDQDRGWDITTWDWDWDHCKLASRPRPSLETNMPG